MAGEPKGRAVENSQRKARESAHVNIVGGQASGRDLCQRAPQSPKEERWCKGKALGLRWAGQMDGRAERIG